MLKCLLAFSALGVASVWLFGVSPSTQSLVIFLLIVSGVFLVFTQTSYAVYMAFEEMKYVALGEMSYAILLLGGIVICLSWHMSIVGFAFSYLIASGVLFIGNFIIVTCKFIRMNLLRKINLKGFRLQNFFGLSWRIFEKAIPFFLSAVVNILALKIDIVMLNVMTDKNKVGWYAAAFHILETTLVIPSIIMGAIYPRLSNFFLYKKISWDLCKRSSVKLALILGMPLATFCYFSSKGIIISLYGVSFSQSIVVLQMLAWVIPLIYITYTCGILLASSDRQWLAFRINAIALIGNVLLNLLLIPLFDMRGAAAATLATSLLTAGGCYYFLDRTHDFQRMVLLMLKVAFMCCISTIILICLCSQVFFINGMIFLGVYILLLIMSHTFSKKELACGKEILCQLGLRWN